MRKPNGYWNNYDRCYEEAKKYHTRKEFQIKARSAYSYSTTNGWINDYTWFEQKSKPSGYWNNYDRCYEEAKKYHNRKEFEKKASAAYCSSRRNGWIDDYTWFEQKRKPNGYWNDYDHCYEEAKKYKLLGDFIDNATQAFRQAKKNGWIDDYAWLELKKRQRGYWNYERCYDEAKKYSSKNEFKLGNSSAYSKSVEKGWLKDYAWFIDKRFDIFKDKIDMVYSYEFLEQHAVYVGRTLMKNKKQRDNQHIFGNDTVSKFAKENNIPVPEMKILEDNLTLKEGVEKEGVWLELYKKDGWTTLNVAKTGSIGTLGIWLSLWNYDSCYEEAKKYRTKTEFYNGNSRAYEVARKNKWLEKYDWFEDGFKLLGDRIRFWTYERCVEESKKYKTLKDFTNKSKMAYKSAYKNNWLDDFVWLERDRIKRNTWKDYDNCYTEAKKYTNVSEFKKNSPGAYVASCKNQWIKDFDWLEGRRLKK